MNTIWNKNSVKMPVSNALPSERNPRNEQAPFFATDPLFRDDEFLVEQITASQLGERAGAAHMNAKPQIQKPIMRWRR